MRLFHERSPHRPNGALGAGDEEECFTAQGRRTGVWLTTEELEGAHVVSCDIDDADVAPFEVTGDGDANRSFVVPAAAMAEFHFV